MVAPYLCCTFSEVFKGGPKIYEHLSINVNGFRMSSGKEPLNTIIIIIFNIVQKKAGCLKYFQLINSSSPKMVFILKKLYNH